MPEQLPLIVFVDDEPGIRNLGAAILTTAGYEVQIATDALDAMLVVQAAGRPIDLLITDIDLPGPSGLQLVELMARTAVIRRALLMSGCSQPGAAEAEVRLPFLPKPFPADALLTTVRRLLNADAMYNTA